ncbi:MAG: hypothetical protein KF819_39910 [Labilithrix sp.]|nr:hypothetical protein [Labilithrix sp.]
MTDDERLKGAFTKLREADADKAPSFDALVRAGRPKRRSPWAFAAPIASLAAAAAALLLWCGTQTMATSSAPQAAPPANAPVASAALVAVDQEPARAIDPAPLDFLLRMPGTSALAAMPSFGTSDLTHGRSR